MSQRCTCQSTTRALRTPRELPRRCPNPNHLRRMSGDRLSSHAPTCFRGYHRRVDRRHAGPTDTGFHQMMLAPRMRRDATCQPSWVKNLHSHPNTISRQTRSRSRISPCADSLGRPSQSRARSQNHPSMEPTGLRDRRADSVRARP